MRWMRRSGVRAYLLWIGAVASRLPAIAKTSEVVCSGFRPGASRPRTIKRRTSRFTRLARPAEKTSAAPIGSHADDLERIAADPDGLTDNLRVPVEPRAPEQETQDRDVPIRVRGLQQASERGRQRQRPEVLIGDRLEHRGLGSRRRDDALPDGRRCGDRADDVCAPRRSSKSGLDITRIQRGALHGVVTMTTRSAS
jgi:hypothetical protein